MAGCTPPSIRVTALQVKLPHIDKDKNPIDGHFVGLQRHLHTDL